MQIRWRHPNSGLANAPENNGYLAGLESPDIHHKGNIFWSRGKVTAAQRESRNGHSGCVIWLTGLSGSGKSTIAVELENKLFGLGRHTYILDGDNVRHG